jgi:LmbE family N-acetylglucosaminyl deacetylase
MLDAKRLLILAPHTDDGELGCGGTIAKYIEAGREIIYVGFSTCSDSLPAHLPADTLRSECTNATKALGISETVLFDFKVRTFYYHRQEILDAMIELAKKYKPEVVFLPAKADIHQDHQVIYSEGLRAFKFCTVLGYELAWNNLQFAPTLFEKLTPELLLKKSTALKEYHSQAHRTYMQEDFIRSLAKVRGVQANVEYAEAFEIYRLMS